VKIALAVVIVREQQLKIKIHLIGSIRFVWRLEPPTLLVRAFFNFMNVYHVLGQHAHWQINKKLAREVGIEAAILLSDLVSKREYFIMNKDISINDWFFNTAENIELDTTLTAHKQRNAIQILCEKGYLELKLMGLPAKNHFKINDVQLLKNLITGYEEFLQQGVKEFNTNNNKEIKSKEENNNNNSIAVEILKKKEEKHKHFALQLLDENNGTGAYHLESLLMQTKIKITNEHTKAFRMHLRTENKYYSDFNDWVRHFRNWLNTKPQKPESPTANRYNLNKEPPYTEKFKG
jgi:hypothetical protein